MSVDYTSLDAAAVGEAIAALSESAAFRALVGAATPTAALARIIESDGGADPDGDECALAVDGTRIELRVGEVQVAHAAVHQTRTASEPIAMGCLRYSGDVTIDLVMPSQSGDTPAEGFRRARNRTGSIRDELWQAARSRFCTVNVDVDGPALEPTTGARGDCYGATLTLHWSRP